MISYSLHGLKKPKGIKHIDRDRIFSKKQCNKTQWLIYVHLQQEHGYEFLVYT